MGGGGGALWASAPQNAPRSCSAPRQANGSTALDRLPWSLPEQFECTASHAHGGVRSYDQGHIGRGVHAQERTKVWIDLPSPRHANQRGPTMVLHG